MNTMNRTIVVVLCMMAICAEYIALALCDMAESIQQLGKIASDKARRINNMKGQQ